MFPRCFFVLARHCLSSPSQRINPADREIWFGLLLEVASVLLTSPLRAQLHKILNSWRLKVPDDFKLGNIGIMLSRKPVTSKLLLSVPSLNRVTHFLSSVGLPHLPDGMKQAYDLCARRWRTPVISLDIGPEVSQAVGLEIAWEGSGRCKPPESLMNWLVAEGLCSEQKRIAINSYPIVVTPDQVRVDWPDDLILESLLGREEQFSCITGQMHHFKLLFRPNKAPELKAYFGYSHTISGVGK